MAGLWGNETRDEIINYQYTTVMGALRTLTLRACNAMTWSCIKDTRGDTTMQVLSRGT